MTGEMIIGLDVGDEGAGCVIFTGLGRRTLDARRTNLVRLPGRSSVGSRWSGDDAMMELVTGNRWVGLVTAR